jgi:hypothetical protein
MRVSLCVIVLLIQIVVKSSGAIEGSAVLMEGKALQSTGTHGMAKALTLYRDALQQIVDKGVRKDVLDAAAALTRKLKLHDEGFRYHQEMLQIKGELGAIPESYLVSFVQMATDAYLGFHFDRALEALRDAYSHLGEAVSAEGVALIRKMESTIYECKGDYATAIKRMEEGTKLGQGVDADAMGLRAELEEAMKLRFLLLRYRLSLQEGLTHNNSTSSAEVAEQQALIIHLEQREATVVEGMMSKGPWRSALQVQPYNP